MTRSAKRCSVPGCREDGHFGRGGAAVPLCYWHGRRFADSTARLDVEVVALKWAGGQQPINRALSAQVDEEEQCSQGRS